LLLEPFNEDRDVLERLAEMPEMLPLLFLKALILVDEDQLGEIGDDSATDESLAPGQRAIAGDAFGEATVFSLKNINDLLRLLRQLVFVGIFIFDGAFRELVAEIGAES
jgi:hypothetical protein